MGRESQRANRKIGSPPIQGASDFCGLLDSRGRGKLGNALKTRQPKTYRESGNHFSRPRCRPMGDTDYKVFVLDLAMETFAGMRVTLVRPFRNRRPTATHRTNILLASPMCPSDSSHAVTQYRRYARFTQLPSYQPPSSYPDCLSSPVSQARQQAHFPDKGKGAARSRDRTRKHHGSLPSATGGYD